MNRESFHALFVDLLANIHDAVVLDSHPIGKIFQRPAGKSIRQSSYLSQLIISEIEGMKPGEPVAKTDTLEWRYYLILSKRYIHGKSMIELQHELSLGDRQLRRLHNRALLALENRIWDLASFQNSTENRLDEDETEPDFKPTLEILSLKKIVGEVFAICQPQIIKGGGKIELVADPEEVLVRVDRVILRQILLGLLEQTLQLEAREIVIRESKPDHQKVQVTIECLAAPGAVLKTTGDFNQQNTFMRRWVQTLNAIMIQAINPAQTHFSSTLTLPVSRQITILVIDDHEQAIRLVQRALRQQPVKVIGETNPGDAMSQVRHLMPDLILLDIMMARTDGWDVLQMLKSDPDTSAIPVVINSVWDRPSLAISLGAYGYLKKPVNEEELVELINELFHPGSSGISSQDRH